MRRVHHALVSPLAFLLAGAGAAASAVPVGAAVASVHRASATSGHLQLAGIPFSYPRLNAAAWILFGLALIGASAIAVTLRAALRQRSAYRRLLARLEVVGHLRDHRGVHVIADPRPQAFCAGYLRPRVYVSQAAVDLLNDAQLDAVLAHEHHHQRVRDPLRLAYGRVVSQALFFVPALRVLFDRYADVAELRADDAAVRGPAGGRAALASALLAFDATGAGISPERVDALLGQTADWRLPGWLLTASFASLSGLVALTSGASQAASARATFNVPFVSTQPCLGMLLLLLFAGVALFVRAARASAGLGVAAAAAVPLAPASCVCDDIEASDGLFGVIASDHEFAALGLAARGVTNDYPEARPHRQCGWEGIVDEFEVSPRPFEFDARDVQRALTDVAYADRLLGRATVDLAEVRRAGDREPAGRGVS